MSVSAKTIEALARLEAIEIEQKELRKILEAPEEGEVASLIYESDTSDLGSNDVFGTNFDLSFQTPRLADKYAEAFETFIQLRQQPGSVGAEFDVKQFVIYSDDNAQKAFVTSWYNITSKINYLSPCFSSEACALDAIEVVGEENIIQMFKTFSHYKEV